MKRPSSMPRLHWSNLCPVDREVSWSELDDSRRVHMTYSGRAAIYQYLRYLAGNSRLKTDRRTVLIPAFHCPTVVDPVVHAGFGVKFYRIDRAMHVDAADLLAKLDETVAAVIFISFFGFAEIDPVVADATRRVGAAVIEDCSHSFLSAAPLRLAGGGADATVYSFWKLVPSLVGGGFLMAGDCDQGDWPALVRCSREDSWRRAKNWGHHLLDRAKGGSRESEVARPAVRLPAEQAYPYDRNASAWRMPFSSRLVLQSVDLQAVATRRRSNYSVLGRAITGTEELQPLRVKLPSDTCPWGFPVILRRRSERDYLIRARAVPVFTFGEVLHPLLLAHHVRESRMVEDAQFLSNNILAFAVHQDLAKRQVEQCAETINDFVRML